MEFLAGIIFTIVVSFIAFKIWAAIERSKARDAYIPPAGSGLDRPIDGRSEFQKKQDL